jgi:alpha-L-arabinofuranosidase
MNIADWEPQHYVPDPDSTFLALLRALRPGLLRWPAGHRSQEYVWVRGGPGQSGDWELTPEHFDAFVTLCRESGAEPLVGINMKRGTPGAAADLVHYANIERGYGVRWLYLGNEPDFVDGMTTGPDEHAARHLAFAAALRAVDPSIRFIGPEIMTGAHVLGSNGTRDWMRPFLEKAGGITDGLSWHWYPLDSGQTNPNSSAYYELDNLFLESTPDWDPAAVSFPDEIVPALRDQAAELAPGADVWVTELGEDPGPLTCTGIGDWHAGALWTAETLGRLATWGTRAVVRWSFTSENEASCSLLGDDYRLRPSYYAYWLYARQFGEQPVDAESEVVREVSAYAALRDDGALTLVLVNKSAAAYDVKVELDGFSPRSAGRYAIVGDSYEATDVTLNGRKLTLDNVEDAPDRIAPEPLSPGNLRRVAMPPLSIVLVVYATEAR